MASLFSVIAFPETIMTQHPTADSYGEEREVISEYYEAIATVLPLQSI